MEKYEKPDLTAIELRMKSALLGLSDYEETEVEDEETDPV